MTSTVPVAHPVQPFELVAGGAQAVIDPGAGGRITSLRFGGHELLVGRRSGDDPLLGGCYPMVPWAGRLRDGRLRFAGRVHHLPARLAPPHAIHGTALTTPWTVEDHGADWARTTVDLGPPWPFGGRAVHHLRLTAHALVLRLEVHAGERPMPASCGWHPWFRRLLQPEGNAAVLDFRAAAMYQRDADGIPTGTLVAPPARPWDDCFTSVARWPILTWPGLGAVSLRSSVAHWVVFDHPHDAICLEPQTGPPDSLNTAPRIVNPGLPLIADVAIQWTAAAGTEPASLDRPRDRPADRP